MKNKKFQHINDTPFPNIENVNVWEYENTFDYSRWGDSASLKLTNVKWDSSYKHLPYFDSSETRNEYFDNLKGASSDLPTRFYALPNQEIKLPYPFSVAARYNYIIVDIPIMTSSGSPITYEGLPRVSRWCYFCEAIEEKAPNTTLCRLTLDVWTTWLGEFEIGSMFLERGHAPMKSINASDYLKNPVMNTKWLIAPDVSYGQLDTVSHRNNIVYNDDVWAVVAFSGNISGTWGEKHNDGWQVPVSNNNISGVPSNQLYAVEKGSIDNFINKIRSNVPQAFQTINAVFFVPKKLVNLGSAINWHDVTIYPVSAASWQKEELITLSKSQFGYNESYAEFAKLYTYPYAQLRLYDHTGNSVTVKIEETTGTLNARAQASMSWPDLNISTYIDGIGTSNNLTLTFANENNRSYPWAGDVERTQRIWGIPTFGVYMSAAIDFDTHNYYNILQRKNEIENSYNVDLASAQAAYDNALASNETTLGNTRRSNETSLGNTRTSNTASKTSADASADTGYTNAEASANTGYSNAVKSADNALSTAKASAKTGLDNSKDSAETNTQNAKSSVNTNTVISSQNRQFARESFLLQGEIAEAQRALGARMSYISFQQGAANNVLSTATQLAGDVMGGMLAGGPVGGAVGVAAGAGSMALGAFTTMIAQANNELFMQYTSAANSQYEELMYGIPNNNPNLWTPGNGILVNHESATFDSINGRVVTLNNENNRVITNYNNNNSLALANNNSANSIGGTLQRVSSANGELITGATMKGVAVRSYETTISNAESTNKVSKENALATRDVSIANASRSRTIAKANNVRSYNATESNAVNSYNATESNAVDSYNTGNENALRTFNAAKNSLEKSKNIANAGINNTIKQAALGAPVQAGVFSNGQTATTRPLAWFVHIETQSIGAIEQAANEFARYGYFINQVWEIGKKLNYGKNFTYWQSTDIWFSKNNLPNEAVKIIRDIFANGVTIWRNPDNIGMVSIFDN